MAGVAIDPLDWSVASRSESSAAPGDGYWVQPVPGGVLVAVVDGMGHGEQAAAATREALRVLMGLAEATPAEQCRSCHAALRGSRGVALGISRFDLEANVLSWIGVGNVRGVLRHYPSSGTPSTEMMLQRRGILGRQLPSLIATNVTIQRGDLLVLATDGIRSDFEDEMAARGSAKRLADAILSRHAAPHDDALVLVARYLGGIG